LRLTPTEATARQIIGICVAEKAYKALCHAYTAALGDYVTPLGVLLAASAPPEEGMKESALEMQTRQNCMRLCLVYVGKVLGGEELLGGEIKPEERLTRLRMAVYEHLFVPSQGVDGADKLVFEHLLEFDAKAFLKALAYKQNKTLLLWAGPIATACNNLQIKCLDVTNSALGDSDAQGLAEIIKKSSSIVEVNAKGNQIGNVGAQHLAKAVEINVKVTRLDMEDNLANEEGLTNLKAILAARQ